MRLGVHKITDIRPTQSLYAYSQKLDFSRSSNRKCNIILYSDLALML